MTDHPSEHEHVSTAARPLAVIRAMIDAVDHDILQLLSRRNGLVAEVAAYKREHGVGIRDLKREEELLADRRDRSVPLGLSPDVVESMYRLMLWASRDRQAALRAEVPLDIESKTIAIIGGHGGMGSLMASLFGDLGHAVMIADLDTHLSPEEAASVADVVMLSVPIDVTMEMIEAIGPCVREDALLMDITSIKVEPVQAMVKHSKATVIGTHPLFGPSVHSVQGQRIVLTPGKSVNGDDWLAWLTTMFKARGLIVHETTPEKHDQAMSIVQVLTHFSTEVLGMTLAKLGVPIDETLQFTSPIYLMDLLMTARHFAQSPDLYASIQMSNPETAHVLEAFTTAATEVRAMAVNKDLDAFRGMFKEVHDYFGDFTDEALAQSSYLIDRLVERQ
ncbi:MAG: bifunctional chorismate mutase/prephenate dehydrogenase [Planctomycetota bacterium]|nr:bifunctional chorismate mutase/prephenate dehydrogenase [Planctomycetota bacterium]